MTVTGNKAQEIFDTLATDFNIYSVSYQYSETTYCTNTVITDREANIDNHYSEYKNVRYHNISRAEAKSNLKKGMPLVIA